MQRSLIVIVLAIVCGLSAAIGVNQLTPPPVVTEATIETTPVYVAAKSIGRGSKIGPDDIKRLHWPSDLVPPGVVSQPADVVGRSALAAISNGEPIFAVKVSDSEGSGFVSNSIEPGMRACTIQTSGPSASVASFIRPDDRVDVLLNLRGTSSDETGGGTSLTLLQNIKILAIDDILDVDNAAAMKLWMQNGVKSVTLLVTPEQALQVALGQAAGSLSLSLRNGDDSELSATQPLTLTQVRSARPVFAVLNEAPDLTTELASTESASTSLTQKKDLPPTYIRTLRGNQVGQVRVVGIPSN